MATERDFAVGLQWLCFGISFLSFGFYGWKVSHGVILSRPRLSTEAQAAFSDKTFSLRVSAGKKIVTWHYSCRLPYCTPPSSPGELVPFFPWNPTPHTLTVRHTSLPLNPPPNRKPKGMFTFFELCNRVKANRAK